VLRSRYETLWKAKDTKNQQANNAFFSMVLEDIQQRMKMYGGFLLRWSRSMKGFPGLRHPSIICGSMGHKGPEEKMVGNAVLHLKGRG
jgi:hypothetical protein